MLVVAGACSDDAPFREPPSRGRHDPRGAGVSASNGASSAGRSGGVGGAESTAGGAGGVAAGGGEEGGAAPGLPARGWQWAVQCRDGQAPSTALEYARCAIEQAKAEAGLESVIHIVTAADAAPAPLLARLASAAESYAVGWQGDEVWVVGRDANGALYGALELAERLTLQGSSGVPDGAAWLGSPELPIRAANVRLTLPTDGESDWWFHDEDYWTKLLDLMAHARLNLLDLHGTFDLRSTLFPNVLLHFARSRSFPDIGAPARERERNLAMLNHVIELAAARGIRVALMTYKSATSLDGRDGSGLDGDDLKTYTREAVQDLTARAENLAYLGFATGESGRDASFYLGTFVAGAQASGSKVKIATPTWLAVKSDVLQVVAAAGKGTLVEAKFNGDHWGADYAIAGGAFASLGSYSYQSYLTPPTPYDFVFQVGAGGTHRIFRQASYERVRRSLRSLAMSPETRGFSLELPDAYYPKRDSYHADPADRVSPWTFVRDELLVLLWGRLGYQSDTPEAVFRAWFERESESTELWPALQAASEIVPWIQSARTCGPDARSFAPELETGGDLAAWILPVGAAASDGDCTSQGPFDRFAIASPAEFADDLWLGRVTTRLSPLDVAARVHDSAAPAASVTVPPHGVWARDVARDAIALSDLGRYFGHKLIAATALAVYTRSADQDWLTPARAESALASAAWRDLAADTAHIRPFTDSLRMSYLGYTPFHWNALTARLGDDGAAIDAAVRAVQATPPAFSGSLPEAAAFLHAARGAGPGLAELAATPADGSAPSVVVTARFELPLPADAQVSVLWKPFDSEHDFQAVAAKAVSGGGYQASLPIARAGALFAVEIASPSAGGFRYPDPTRGAPYIALPPSP
jgi:hypothetical protein